MPALNIKKIYRPNAYYHIYNRRVEKNILFNDIADHQKFITIIDLLTVKSKLEFTKSMHNNIRLLSYCLMPNHFHMLVWQRNERDIAKYLKSISIRYSMYFNLKYEHSGCVFQSRYKAVLLRNERSIQKTYEYIRNNPVKAGLVKNPDDYKWLGSHPAGCDPYSIETIQ